MRAVIRGFDAWVSRQNRIFAFCDEEACMLRLQFTNAPHDVQLDGIHIAHGETVLAIHLWNEHMPRIAKSGADFAWASKTLHMYRHSLHLAARYVQANPHMPAFRAVMGITSLFGPPSGSRSSHPMERFGFTVLPYRSPLGRFGEFWENFYAWALIWTYNPVSARGWNPFTARRAEIWMSAADFMARYAT